LAVDASNNKKVTSASYSFVPGDVGGWIDVTGGTGWTVGRYGILSVSGTAAVLDASPAAANTTNGTYILNRGKQVFTAGTTNDTLRVCALKSSVYGWQAAW
jgi:hypothetical protein